MSAHQLCVLMTVRNNSPWRNDNRMPNELYVGAFGASQAGDIATEEQVKVCLETSRCALYRPADADLGKFGHGASVIGNVRGVRIAFVVSGFESVREATVFCRLVCAHSSTARYKMPSAYAIADLDPERYQLYCDWETLLNVHMDHYRIEYRDDGTAAIVSK